MVNPDVTVFAQTNYREQNRLFGIKRDDRRRHMYIVGKTGMGKSTLLEQLIFSDIQSGAGLAVVDPHGDLAEKVLDFIPSSRVNDVIYFNPADQDFPIAFNILETVNPEVRHLIASGLVGVFKKIWAESWGPRLEYVLRNAILALLDYPGSTLLGVLRILTDKTFRKKVIEKVQDPVVKSFWVDEYSKYPDRFQAEAIAPIQNKVGQFLSNALIRNVVGQVKSSIDIRDVMDNQKILILNLSKGRIGEDTSALLGAMMITQLQLGAMSRIDMLEHERKDFYLYVDEFQNFATESFANILSEARKYRLNLTIAHQYIEQLDEKVQGAVFGNVGTLVCFRVGAADAEVLVKEFAPYFTEEDLVNLAKWQVYLKLMIDGVASNPFSANILPPVPENYGNRDKIIRVSRERYAKDKKTIEDKIARWASSLEQAGIEEQRAQSTMPPRSDRGGFGGPSKGNFAPRPIVPLKPEFQIPPQRPAPPPKAAPTGHRPAPDVKSQPDNASGDRARPVLPPASTPSSAPPPTSVPTSAKVEKVAPKEKTSPPPPRNAEALPFEATCVDCGKQTRLSFKPDASRPVYCKECLHLVRTKKKQQQKREPVASIPKVPPNDPEPTVSTPRQESLAQPHHPTPVKPGQEIVFE